MLKGEIARHTLKFVFTARTSRETLTEKTTWYVRLRAGDRIGVGECALFQSLSPIAERDDFEGKLRRCVKQACRTELLDASDLNLFSAIRTGLETAFADLSSDSLMTPFEGSFSRGETSIPINGLVWMGSKEEMAARIDEKLAKGFRCLKLKIGGIDFEQELVLLEYIRQRFPTSKLTLRLDANGAFAPDEALSKLKELSQFGVHSIEQPIRAGQIEEMAMICRHSTIPIALDEELIGYSDYESREKLIEFLRPAYAVIKPTLAGGFSGAQQWIEATRRIGAGWWLTSALESNVGLNALAQWVSQRMPSGFYQGLGTGKLYDNNIPSPLEIDGEVLKSNHSNRWNLSKLNWEPVC